jgi:branched-chain amino acid transport system permease protein
MADKQHAEESRENQELESSQLEKKNFLIRKPIATAVIFATLVLMFVVGRIGGLSQVINAIISGGMWALMATGLTLILGVMNVPNFFHGESFMVGSYVAFFIFNPINKYLMQNPSPFLGAIAPFIGFIIAAVVGFGLGMGLERLVFHPLRVRTKARWVMNSFLLTVGVSFILTNGTNLVLGPNFRGIPRYWDVSPVTIITARMTIDRIIAFGIAAAALIGLWYFMRKTKTGRAIRAVSQDEDGASMVGVNINRIHTLTFGLGTAMAALAGAALLFMFQAYPTVGLKPLYFSWFVVMLVGLGNVSAAVIGGFIVAVLQTATQQFFGVAWEEVVPTVIMMLVLIVAPSGIFGSEVKGVQEQ